MLYIGSLNPYTLPQKFLKSLRFQFTQYGTPIYKRFYKEEI